MEAAKAVFSARGVEKTTMKDILAKTSLSKGG